ncbi:MAG: tol-pal system-associated acyl-CoA thioesterase [Gammaproteobacteria bacterium]|jgi:acyl-CoA thioester hydrolase|nr:tol-pal system-associated acyl-CoA thioesterase [Gammaproteobacteria bacterium]
MGSSAVRNYRLPIRIYYEDTDAGGVVYYANYLKFLERARTEWLRSFGFEQDQLREQEGILFAVRSVNIHYVQAARFNQQVISCVDDFSLKRASIAIQQSIIMQDGGAAVVNAEVNIVCLDCNEFSPKPIPERLYRELLACK